MNYVFTKNNKTLAIALMVIGLAAVVFGFMTDVKRIWASLLIGNFYLMAIALAGTFIVAINYAAQSGWPVLIKRVPEAMGQYLPFAGIFMLLIFIFGGHDIYHWTHHTLYEPLLADGTPNPEFDPIINGKKAFLNTPFFIVRMILYFVIWSGFTWMLRRESLREDLNGGLKHYNKSVTLSAVFLVLFAITSSTSAWDFLMSIETHWFSTLFGWYTFSGMFISGLVVTTIAVLYLKDNGYMPRVNANHIHDLGKFVFAFSVFWTYLWFSQFMLIWYANIPEEVIYFVQRIEHYKFLFAANLVVNFMFPLLMLMSRPSKRNYKWLMVVCLVLIGGHWVDLFLIVMPGVVGAHWHIGFIEVGTTLGFIGLFMYVFFSSLAKAPLEPANHPMLVESVHHHI